MFIDLKHVKRASISLDLELDLAPDDRIEFEVARPPLPLPIQWFGDKRGRIPTTTVVFDLSKYCGHDAIEFRIVFRSRRNAQTLGYRGVTVHAIQVISS